MKSLFTVILTFLMSANNLNAKVLWAGIKAKKLVLFDPNGKVVDETGTPVKDVRNVLFLPVENSGKEKNCIKLSQTFFENKKICFEKNLCLILYENNNPILASEKCKDTKIKHGIIGEYIENITIKKRITLFLKPECITELNISGKKFILPFPFIHGNLIFMYIPLKPVFECDCESNSQNSCYKVETTKFKVLDLFSEKSYDLINKNHELYQPKHSDCKNKKKANVIWPAYYLNSCSNSLIEVIKESPSPETEEPIEDYYNLKLKLKNKHEIKNLKDFLKLFSKFIIFLYKSGETVSLNTDQINFITNFTPRVPVPVEKTLIKILNKEYDAKIIKKLNGSLKLKKIFQKMF